ncbi:PREDICTED: SWI/SNF-related matrix-associated actin-dependent regulator of chromatin subfamily A-like protein 1 [Polistes dominula]|uniref:SWI/SNF-related matrix-associated actin-dependent regulator of chromatin subfamily A-like protein 1 n=1 Tax=Polistes dominula TaxID=743375 RepID=A0ABM1IMD5_POLDO|nr:PREDICTED: SWI/SNF-related matrix-associated actin-dependent regulator of chromatin subfamily A-like protein 1 [Polistes dominula]
MANVKDYSKEEIKNKHLEALERKKKIQQLKRTSECSVAFPVRKSQYTPSNAINSAVALKSNNSKIGPIRTFNSVNKYAPKTPVTPKEPKNFFGTNSVITVKCYMITNDKFAVETSSYLSSVIDVFKTMNSRSYDSSKKTWSFHLTDYENLIKKLIELKSNLSIIQIPASVIRLFKQNYSSSDTTPSINLLSIDETLRSTLMPFQEEGIRYGISKKGRCIIADDMGLGKTIQALGIASFFQESWPLLIVAPSTVRYQWSEAIFNYLPSIPAHYIHQFTNVKDFNNDVKIVIVSYDLLARSEELFKSLGFGFVILDESHTIKNNKTFRFKAVQKIASNSKHVVLLSGTPALSRPIELYTQINLVIPNFMGYQEYGIRYCAGIKKNFGWDFTGSSNMQELQLLLKLTCMIRRLKDDVLNQLPSKIRQVIILDPDMIKQDIKKQKEFDKSIPHDLKDHSALLQYYNKSSFLKLRAIRDYVTRIFSNKQKCLIFAHHKHVLDAICEVAKEMDIGFIRIDGSVNSNRRTDAVNNFQNDSNCLAAILSITAANSGITLTAARLVVFAELFWNPGILFQAEDRVHRIGQNDSVIIQYLVAKQTADDHLWSLLRSKINTLNKAGLNQNDLMENTRMDQTLDSHQLRIDKFVEKHQNKSLEMNEPEKKEETSIDDIKELLNFDNEDLQDCDFNF